MFGLFSKKGNKTRKMSEQRAIVLFHEHCHSEAKRVKDNIEPYIQLLCQLPSSRIRFEQLLSLPLLGYTGLSFHKKPRSLLEAHCLAMTTAVGLKAMWEHLRSQFTEWAVSRLIVEEDVGKENVGHAPNPRPSPGVHYTYPPGTFVGGIPSPQWELTERYRRLHTGIERLVMLLMSLTVHVPSEGVRLIVYEEVQVAPGTFGKNRIGSIPPPSGQLDEWEQDLEITDAELALCTLPQQIVEKAASVVDNINAFWPELLCHYSLYWEKD